MRMIAYGLIGVLTLLLQSVVLPRILPPTWIPDVFLMWIVVLTLLRGRQWGLVVALAGGLIQDIVISNYFGLHTVPFLVIAYVMGRWEYTIYEEQWYATVFWSIGITVLDVCLRAGMLWLGQENIQVIPYVLHRLLVPIACNAIIASVLHVWLWKDDKANHYVW